VATENAVETFKARADIVTRAARGAGVAELADALVESDLSAFDTLLARHDVAIGTSRRGEDVRLRPLDRKVLVAGPSGSGKSTLVTAFLEALIESKYQVCVIDPEGDYESFPDVVRVGDSEREPTTAEVLDILASPARSVVVNLIAVKVEQRPAFFAALLPGLMQLRAKTGRPHWLVVDEAHHLLPADLRMDPATLAGGLPGALFITVHPDQIWQPALDDLDVVLATGPEPHRVLASVPNLGTSPMADVPVPESGESLIWSYRNDASVVFKPNPPHSERLRHRRKYATGELGPDRSFFFTGPNGSLNLRAQNLMLFMQLADGVDDETWTYHLGRGDYSRWFRDAIKDDDLAADAAAIERDGGPTPADTRRRIRAAIEERYTKPASSA
jgi:energy-coupling factor transporter ATP-binding protein EcfA2